jgi:hypothetical protein
MAAKKTGRSKLTAQHIAAFNTARGVGPLWVLRSTSTFKATESLVQQLCSRCFCMARNAGRVICVTIKLSYNRGCTIA